MNTSTGKVLFYPVILIPGRSGTGRARPGPFRWLAPRDTPAQAKEDCVWAVKHEDASMGVVVRFADDGSTPMILTNYIVPTSVRTPIEKYLTLVGLIAEEQDR